MAYSTASASVKHDSIHQSLVVEKYCAVLQSLQCQLRALLHCRSDVIANWLKLVSNKEQRIHVSSHEKHETFFFDHQATFPYQSLHFRTRCPQGAICISCNMYLGISSQYDVTYVILMSKRVGPWLMERFIAFPLRVALSPTFLVHSHKLLFKSPCKRPQRPQS